MRNKIISLILLFLPQIIFANEKTELTDPDPGRIIWSPTAITKKKNSYSLTNFNLAIWNLDYTYSENLTVGFRTITPVGFISGAPMAKLTFHSNDKLHFGFWVEAGGLHFFGFGEDFSAYYFGGGPIFTVGNADRCLNMSVFSYYAGADNESNYIIIPNLGGSVRISRLMKLNSEILFFVNDETEKSYLAFLYGVRLGSEHIYGDIGFVMPFIDNIDFYKIMPLGFPMLSLGFTW